MPRLTPMRFAQALDEAASWLEERRRGEISVLAVDGHSAAGKSRFVEALAGRTGAALVRGDDFYRVVDETERAELAPAEGVELYYDWQRMRAEVLLPLRAGMQPSTTGCAGAGRPLADIAGSAIIAALRRPDGELVPQPSGETIVQPGDVLIAMGTASTMDRLEALFAPTSLRP